MKYVANPVVVDAFKIVDVAFAIDYSSAVLTLDDGIKVECAAGMTARYKPISGDYYIIQEDGYAYINPAEVFEKKYSASKGNTQMNFSEALHLIKKGYLLKRAGWNGKDQFVFLVNGSDFKVNRAPLLGIFEEGTEVTYRPHIDMKYQDGTIGVWLASMGDLMAEDWEWIGAPE